MDIATELGVTRGAIDGPEEEALLNLLRTHGMFRHHADRECFAGPPGLARFAVLLALEMAGEDALRQKELAYRLASTKGTVSHHLRRLEEAGLIVREVDERDRRARLVTISTRGRKVVRSVRPRYLRLVKRVCRDVGAREMRALVRALTRMRDRIPPADAA